MTIWKTLPITDQPEIILDQWQIFELPNGDRHFNGYCPGNREGRVSSKIVEFDNETMQGRTRSGRVYKLSEWSGNSSDGIYVLGRWLKINSLTHDDIKYVTDEVIKKSS